MATRQIRVQRLTDPYKGWGMFANQLQKSNDTAATNKLKQEQLDIDTRKLNHSVQHDNRYMDYLTHKEDNSMSKWQEQFDFEKMQQQSKNLANTQVLKTVRPDIYSNIGQQYGQVPSVENANMMNRVAGNVDINAVMPQKTTYKTFEGIGADGKPTVYTMDNNGIINNTGINVYQKPKILSAEQQDYYQERANNTKYKNQQAMLKILMQNPNYINAPENIQTQAQQQLMQTGQIPTISYDDGGWFGGDSYSVVNSAGPIANNVNDVNYVNPGNQTVLNGTPVQSKPIQSLQELNQSINAIGNIDTSHENKTYSNRNTRDLVKAKQWAQNEGQRYLVDLWLPSDEQILKRYLQYGKGVNSTVNNGNENKTNMVQLTKDQEHHLNRLIDKDMKILMH